MKVSHQLLTVFTLGLLSVLPAPHAQARLGETMDECEARYGKGRARALELGTELEGANLEGWEAKSYNTHGLMIQVLFVNEEAVLIKYANEAIFRLEDSSASPLNLTSGEIAHLKKINLGGQGSWNTLRDPIVQKVAPTLTTWRSSDGSRYSGYDREQREFFVCTSDFWTVILTAVKERVSGTKSGGASARFEGL